MEYSVLSRIDSTRHNWRIKVRVSRMWHLSGTSKGRSFAAVELILVDEEETGITASIGENKVAKFLLSIVEGHAYFFQNFHVSKERQNPTNVSVVYAYTIFLKPDIIGKLIVVHPLVQSSTLNGPSVRHEFLLEAIGKDEPVVVFARLYTKLFLGNASCRNSAGTKWYINIDIPEVNAFRASLQGKGSEVLLLPGDGDAAVENIDGANANRKSISELLSLNPNDNNVGLIGPSPT
ncbi:hypothetical protein ABZP36_019431 [Zizania latifolia]